MTDVRSSPVSASVAERAAQIAEQWIVPDRVVPEGHMIGERIERQNKVAREIAEALRAGLPDEAATPEDNEAKLFAALMRIAELEAELRGEAAAQPEATEDDIAAVIVAAQTSNSNICAAALLQKFTITRRVSIGEAATPGAQPIDHEKFCIAYAWCYGTALEREHYGKEPDDGLTPETLWEKAGDEERDFMRGIVKDTFSMLAPAQAAPVSSTHREGE
jgi:hypothetical protein